MSIHLENTEWDIEPKVGSYVELENGVNTVLCQDDTGWDLCQFRIPAGGGLYQLAVNVEVTGWTLQRRGAFGSEFIRIKLTYVADPMDVDIYTGERQSEDVSVGGWMRVTEREKVWNQEKADALLAEAERIARIREEHERQERAEAEAAVRTKAEAVRRGASRAAALEL